MIKNIIFSKGNCPYMFSYYSNLAKKLLTGYKTFLSYLKIELF